MAGRCLEILAEAGPAALAGVRPPLADGLVALAAVAAVAGLALALADGALPAERGRPPAEAGHELDQG